MTTIREAFDAMGYELKDSETVCIVYGDENYREYRLEDVADRELVANLFYSTGTFPKGQRFGSGGRTLTNVDRILEFPFDFDLKDFLGQDKDAILSLSDDEVQSYTRLLQQAIEDVFARVGLPIHRLDYTGNGLSAHIAIPSHDKEHVKQLKDWHAGIVNRINTIYGSNLADLNVKDAGPRIMRLAPAPNIKITASGEIVTRQPRVIYSKKGFVDQAMLEAAADVIVWQGTKAEIPYEGDHLSPDEMQAIVDTYQPYHTPGQKHFLALAIAGQLAKMRVPEAQALQIVEAIAAQDKKPWDRQNGVRDTYRRIRNGEAILGYHAIKEMVPADEISRVDQILETAKRRCAPRLLFDNATERGSGKLSEEEWINLFRPPLLPDKAFYGWHREWRDLVRPTTGAADAFHLAASTTLQAAMMGRRIGAKYAGSTLYPNQYTFVIGRTKSYKDTAYARTIDMVNNAVAAASQSRQVLSPPFSVQQDFASREALIETLSTHPNTYLFSTEATTLLKNATREGTSTLLDALIQAWDNKSEISTNSIRARKENSGIAMNPYLNIYAGSQPDRISKYMTEEMIASGLGNRIAFFMGVRRNNPSQTPEIDFERSVELFHELGQAINWYPDNSRITMDPDALRYWDDWFRALPTEFESEDVADMTARHSDIAQKWALMFAVLDRAEAIERRHLEPAIVMIEWMWKCVQMMLPTWGVSTERKIEERIIAVLQQRQPLSKRDLNRYVRGKWTAREFATVFRAMKDNQQIFMDASDRYVALSPHDVPALRKDA